MRWSPRRGSDPDGITARSFQGYCVYQFRHAGTVLTGKSVIPFKRKDTRVAGEAPPRLNATGPLTVATENVGAFTIARYTTYTMVSLPSLLDSLRNLGELEKPSEG